MINDVYSTIKCSISCYWILFYLWSLYRFQNANGTKRNKIILWFSWQIMCFQPFLFSWLPTTPHTHTRYKIQILFSNMEIDSIGILMSQKFKQPKEFIFVDVKNQMTGIRNANFQPPTNKMYIKRCKIFSEANHICCSLFT